MTAAIGRQSGAASPRRPSGQHPTPRVTGTGLSRSTLNALAARSLVPAVAALRQEHRAPELVRGWRLPDRAELATWLRVRVVKGRVLGFLVGEDRWIPDASLDERRTLVPRRWRRLLAEPILLVVILGYRVAHVGSSS